MLIALKENNIGKDVNHGKKSYLKAPHIAKQPFSEILSKISPRKDKLRSVCLQNVLKNHIITVIAAFLGFTKVLFRGVFSEIIPSTLLCTKIFTLFQNSQTVFLCASTL